MRQRCFGEKENQ